MAEGRELVPLAVRIAIRNAVGGWGPFRVREIEELFQSHGFTEQDASVPDEGGGIRRTTVDRYHARIDWSSEGEAGRYLTLVSDVLELYPEGEDAPGSPGRNLRRALARAGLVGEDGALRLASGVPAQVEPDVEGIWTPRLLRIFFSHVTTAREQVGQLATALESFDCSGFVAHVQIEPSRDWQDVIETALRTCHVLVAWVTPDFHASPWTDQEVGWALGRPIQVVPMNAGQQAYGLFGMRQSIAVGSRTPWEVADAVFEAIVGLSLRTSPPVEAVDAGLIARTIVGAFRKSPSFDSTRKRFPLLQRIPQLVWTGDMLDQLSAAVEANDQVREAFLGRVPVPDAVRELIERVNTDRG